MKSVLIVCSLYLPHTGGIETMVREMCRYYLHDGIRPIVLTKRWPEYLPVFDTIEGISVFRCPAGFSEYDLGKINVFLKDNEKLLKSDVVHSIGVRRPLPLFALMLARKWGVPVISTVAGGDVPDEGDPNSERVWVEGADTVPEALRQVDYLNCVSNALIKDLLIALPGVEIGKTLYAGIDRQMIQDAKPEKISEDFILSLRRLDPSKGIDVLVKAFSLLQKDFPELRLIIAGEGSEEQGLRLLVSSLFLENKVSFIGTVSLERAFSLLKGATMTVVPSLSEGGGLVNVEAQAAGCPLIASRVGGIPEYVLEGESGLLVKAGSVAELELAMRRVLSDKDLRERLRRGGLSYSHKFDWGTLLPQYKKLYEGVLAENISNTNFKPWSDKIEKMWRSLCNE